MHSLSISKLFCLYFLALFKEHIYKSEFYTVYSTAHSFITPPALYELIINSSYTIIHGENKQRGVQRRRSRPAAAPALQKPRSTET